MKDQPMHITSPAGNAKVQQSGSEKANVTVAKPSYIPKLGSATRPRSKAGDYFQRASSMVVVRHYV